MLELRSLASCLAALTCGGCDQVFGLTGYERACALPAPTQPPSSIASAESFSIAESGLLVGTFDGAAFELATSSSTAAPQPIDLGIYVNVSLALAPEGDQLFHSGVIEPPLLQSSRRTSDGTWVLDGFVPEGAYAGAPTATRFGPRRMLVRLHDAGPDVQEYVETDAGTWQTLDAPFTVGGAFAPALSPDGLTAVYSDVTGVFAIQRDTLDDRFGSPRMLIAGSFLSPALSASCDALFAVDPATLAVDRFAR